MRFFKCMLLCVGIAAASFVFNSCSNDEAYSLDKAWYSIATVRSTGDGGTYWLTLDSGTSLWPVATDIPWYNPKELQRAFVVYSLLSDEFQGFDHAIKIWDIKSILTKPIAENLGAENDSIYGTDPVDISDLWIGDGFLNIVFEFNYGGDTVHFINLLKNDSVRTPFFYEFRHNAYNDNPRYWRKGIVAFDLSSVDTLGEEVELTIQVNTFNGTREYKIKYHSLINQEGTNRNYSMDSFVETK